jgi:YjbE family integral membrane protein
MIQDLLNNPQLPLLLSQASAFFQVVMIDLVMAGDNAIAVGLAAAGLPADKRRQAIMWGLIAAIVTRIICVLLTVELLKIIGLLLAGGILLVWVAWRMWRELREHDEEIKAEASIEDATGIDLDSSPSMSGAIAAGKKPKTLRAAIVQILIADISMSLDNVLAVAGAAHDHLEILVFGLVLSIILMGVAAHVIANVLHKHRWIGYIGLLIILFVATRMIWEGSHQVYEQKDVWLPFVEKTLNVKLS